MAKSTLGKQVSRVGASGGGKTYRKVRPVNYYGVMSVLVALGLLLVVFSRYEYQHPATSIEPIVGRTWYAALGTEACGKQLPSIAADKTTSPAGLRLISNNVIQIAPRSASESGNNATFATFVNEHMGMVVSPTKFALPNAILASDPNYTYHDGDKCPAGSKYAGQTGHIVVAYWSTISQSEPTIVSDTKKLKLGNLMRITVAFEPKGVTPMTPAASTVSMMLQVDQGTNATTSTVAAG